MFNRSRLVARRLLSDGTRFFGLVCLFSFLARTHSGFNVEPNWLSELRGGNVTDDGFTPCDDWRQGQILRVRVRRRQGIKARDQC